jgi:hypothetical protein
MSDRGSAVQEGKTVRALTYLFDRRQSGPAACASCAIQPNLRRCCRDCLTTPGATRRSTKQAHGRGAAEVANVPAPITTAQRGVAKIAEPFWCLMH